ncbi:hypothetical protein VFPPC_14724 [Pochonia chlamydosporia 170]|uniref:Uncharacterized protein n=1 Tax=Pochonia chlamydosporia 170 TaxID=1380566 RepID=A0A179F1X0_METCM|nr:hypothetical protein VFPPC_14724 [Pochonia chlamydosporia 170]OAQ59113.1 hypothetical protein VFPPC_14724 [Pochonia chlamydosporia 170]
MKVSAIYIVLTALGAAVAAPAGNILDKKNADDTWSTGGNAGKRALENILDKKNADDTWSTGGNAGR